MGTAEQRVRRCSKSEGGSVPTVTSRMFRWWARRKCAFAHPTAALLRRNLPRGWRWIDEGRCQLRVARFRIRYCLLLDRAVAADAVGQRENFHRGVVGDRRQEAEHGDDVLFVACDQVALELAVGAVA